MDDVARVDQAKPRAAVERRTHDRVVEDRLGVVDRGLVLLDLGGVLGHLRLLGVGLLVRAVLGFGELLITGEIDLGIGEQRLVLGLLGECLIVLGLIGRGVDAGDDVAAPDLLAVLEREFDDPAVHLRPHRDRVGGLHGAEHVGRHGHVGGPRRRGQHGNGSVGGGAPPSRAAPAASPALVPGRCGVLAARRGREARNVGQPGEFLLDRGNAFRRQEGAGQDDDEEQEAQHGRSGSLQRRQGNDGLGRVGSVDREGRRHGQARHREPAAQRLGQTAEGREPREPRHRGGVCSVLSTVTMSTVPSRSRARAMS